MSDTAYGYHAVESLIRREPRRVAALHVQADRQDTVSYSHLTQPAIQDVLI